MAADLESVAGEYEGRFLAALVDVDRSLELRAGDAGHPACR